MDGWLASFFMGAILSLFLPIVPDIFVLFSLLLLAISFFCYKPLRLSSGLLFGLTWMLFNALNFQQLWQENNLNAVKLATQSHWLQGQVLSLHSMPEKPLVLATQQLAKDTLSIVKPLRFNFNVSHINQLKLNNSIQLRLSWKNASLALQQGQVVQLKVKFKPAHGLANLGGFSYQTWLNSKGISGTGYVVNHANNQVLIAELSIRQQLYNRYKTLLPDSAEPESTLAPLLLALAFGSRMEITADLWQVLQATGTGHLIAISGLHIGLVATGSYVLFMWLLRLLPLHFFAHSAQLQTMNIRYLGIGVSLTVALAYGYLAGFSLPTLRALVMLSLYWGIRLLAIRISIKRWLLLTLFFLTLSTPFSLFTASFWLSVYAVVIIFMTLWRFKKTLAIKHFFWRFMMSLMVIQLSLSWLLLPINAVFFQQISALSLFANIIAVPWMSLLTIPLCLLSVLLMPISLTLSQFFIMLCLASLQWLWQYLDFLSRLSWTVLTLSSFYVQLLVLVGLLSVILLFFQPKLCYVKVRWRDSFRAAWRCCAVIMIVVAISFSLWRSARPPAMSEPLITNSSNSLIPWQLIVFDVGQGLSVLIQRQQKAILYDTGASYASGFNMVSAVVLPYLQYAGIQQLDKVIISHSDNDHAGGLAVLQQSIAITDLLYNGSNTLAAAACIQGKRFFWQGLSVEMLWPKTNVGEENDDSCVLYITDGKHKVLLTGDISKQVENKILQQYPQLRSDVLVVPHHGSNTSSSNAFISQLNPAFAIVSAGFLNRWQMPVAKVVQRYQENNTQLLNSADLGQIIFNFSDKGITQQSYHQDLWPFWFANAADNDI